MINIENKKDCTGCHACANICPKNCISMDRDIEGFIYPIINKSKCIECNLCENVCPLIHEKKINNNPIAFACYNKDELIRKKSSSGGIFSLLAQVVIENNGVVFGAKFDENFNVIHDYTLNIDEVAVFRGAKYVQSTIGNTYKDAKEFLDKGKIVLYSGTPCQISGLKRYLGKDYDSLFCVDLICHGVPSHKAWDKYKNYLSDGKQIESISFRDKTYGWKSYSVKVKFKGGSEKLIKGSEDKYIRGFIGDIYLRPSCHDCKFKTLNRESDITLADFWGVNNVREEMDDDKGTSLIFVNSDRGSKLLEFISDNIVKKRVDINEAVKYNLSAIKSSYYNPRREYFFKNIDKFSFEKLVKKSLMDPLDIRIKTKILKILKK